MTGFNCVYMIAWYRRERDRLMKNNMVEDGINLPLSFDLDVETEYGTIHSIKKKKSELKMLIHFSSNILKFVKNYGQINEFNETVQKLFLPTNLVVLMDSVNNCVPSDEMNTITHFEKLSKGIK